MAEVDSAILTLIKNEIPEGRQALRDGHENLAKVAAYCEQKYIETNNRYKSGADRGKALEETRAVLEETKQFATQSLASVAYQINTLALNMLGLFDQQILKLQDMETEINHISETLDIHKEKVSRREIGVLASSKPTGRTHKVMYPANTEKATRYSRKPTDYSVLDQLGHGAHTIVRQGSQRQRQPSVGSKLPPQTKQTEAEAAENKGTLRGKMAPGTAKRRPLSKPPPPPVPPPMPPSVPFSDPGLPPPPSSILAPPVSPYSPANDSMIPPPPPPPLPGVSSGPSSPGIPFPPPPPGGLTTPPPPSLGEPILSPPPPPSLAMHTATAQLPPPDLIPPPEIDGTNAYESVVDAMASSPLPPPPPSVVFNHSPSSLPVSPSPEDLSQVPPPPPPEEQSWVPQNYVERVVSLYEYVQQRDDELTFQEGVIIYVIKKNDDGWYEGVTEDGVTGLFPGNYVEVCL